MLQGVEKQYQNMLSDDNTVRGFSNDDYKEYQDEDKKLTMEELYDANTYLPKETRKDWFEVIDSQIKTEDASLINVAKFIGVDTVGSSMKNATRDLRGAPPVPKYNVGVWNNSSYDPDHNIMGLCVWKSRKNVFYLTYRTFLKIYLF